MLKSETGGLLEKSREPHRVQSRRNSLSCTYASMQMFISVYARNSAPSLGLKFSPQHRTTNAVGYQQFTLNMFGRWLRISIGFSHLGGRCCFLFSFVFYQSLMPFFKVKNLVDKTLTDLTVWMKLQVGHLVRNEYWVAYLRCRPRLRNQAQLLIGCYYVHFFPTGYFQGYLVL